MSAEYSESKESRVAETSKGPAVETNPGVVGSKILFYFFNGGMI